MSDHVFLTKEGELGCLIRVDPIPFESLDDADLEHKTAMFVAALGNLDASMRVYQYVTKHGDPDLPVRVPSARTRFLEENKERLFSMETHWAIVYEVERPGNKNQAEIDAQIRLEAQYLTTVVTGFLGSMAAVLESGTARGRCRFRFSRMAGQL